MDQRQKGNGRSLARQVLLLLWLSFSCWAASEQIHYSIPEEMIIESTLPGTRFLLGKAEDPDIGMNSIQNYQLSPNPYFTLDVKESQDGNKFADLVLQKTLDRETEQTLQLILTATDGGEPRKTGTAQIWINVTDANDNAPSFTQDIYKSSLKENIAVGSFIVQVLASDNDEGSNAEIKYYFNNIPVNAEGRFSLHSNTGTITLIGPLDYEEAREYTMTVAAKDGGGMETYCKVEISILDENDNAPEVTLVSLFSPVSEDSLPGTLIALIKVQDKDAGDNGKVTCHLQDAPNSCSALLPSPIQMVAYFHQIFKMGLCLIPISFVCLPSPGKMSLHSWHPIFWLQIIVLWLSQPMGKII
uniref:Cadherin domain-containing protein n=1 Tax=Varanus komodoensis TaxID=61221 RepID=A0A8D2KVN5_VARKO